MSRVQSVTEGERVIQADGPLREESCESILQTMQLSVQGVVERVVLVVHDGQQFFRCPPLHHRLWRERVGGGERERVESRSDPGKTLTDKTLC